MRGVGQAYTELTPGVMSQSTTVRPTAARKVTSGKRELPSKGFSVDLRNYSSSEFYARQQLDRAQEAKKRTQQAVQEHFAKVNGASKQVSQRV